MKMHHVYPAVLKKLDDKMVLIFPEFPQIELEFAQEETEEIMIQAREALGEQIFQLEYDGCKLPEASKLFSISQAEKEVVLLVGVHMRRYYMEQKAVKKTLTIPNWLNVLAEEEGINFSQLLQESLVETLRFREGLIRESHGHGRHHFRRHEDIEELRGRHGGHSHGFHGGFGRRRPGGNAEEEHGRGSWGSHPHEHGEHGSPGHHEGHDHSDKACDCGEKSHSHGHGPVGHGEGHGHELHRRGPGRPPMGGRRGSRE